MAGLSIPKTITSVIYWCDSFFIFILMEYTIQDFFNEIRNGNLEQVVGIYSSNPRLLNAKDERGSTPLILATYYGHAQISRFLLENGADVEAKDGSGNTALLGVSFKGHTEMVKELITQGADVNSQNATGATSLIYAVSANKEEVVKVLLANKADVSKKDARGFTALDHAKIGENPILIELLENE